MDVGCHYGRQPVYATFAGKAYDCGCGRQYFQVRTDKQAGSQDLPVYDGRFVFNMGYLARLTYRPGRQRPPFYREYLSLGGRYGVAMRVE